MEIPDNNFQLELNQADISSFLSVPAIGGKATLYNYE